MIVSKPITVASSNNATAVASNNIDFSLLIFNIYIYIYIPKQIPINPNFISILRFAAAHKSTRTLSNDSKRRTIRTSTKYILFHIKLDFSLSVL